MTIPSYTTLGINDHPMIDTWQQPDVYLDPLQTDMEGGNKRLRSRPGDDVQHFTFDVLLTNAEYATFKTFVLTTLGRGTARFTMRIWNGTSMESRTVQFANKFKPNPMPPKFTSVSFDLWAFPS